MKIKQIEWEHNPDFKVCKRYEAKLAFGTFASIMYFGKGWEWKIKLGLADIAGGVSVSLEDAKRGCQAQWERLWRQVVEVSEGCEYCTKNKELISTSSHDDNARAEVSITKGNDLCLTVSVKNPVDVGGSYQGIAYCPMCGKKLKETE